MGIPSIPEYLARLFFERLRDLAPASVLDVGCGRGQLLRECHDSGIPVHGVEPDKEFVAELIADGEEATVAPAEALPFDDRSFDWVTLRHISHHLADERPAMAEAFRVCRSGVLVAEPWLDLTIASQRVARRFDAWLEEQHTRTDSIHRIPLSAGNFLAAVPDGVAVESELEQILVLRDRPAKWLTEKAEPFVRDLPTDHPACVELAAITTAAQLVGLTYNGTAILTLRRCGE